MRTVRAFLQKNANILRNDAQHRGLQGALDIVDRLHARVEILDEECQPDTDDQNRTITPKGTIIKTLGLTGRRSGRPGSRTVTMPSSG